MMLQVTDQLGEKIGLERPAKRVISLVPSLTETIVDLGCEDSLVGITRYCVHPPKLLETKTVVGGTKKIVLKRVKELQPDLVICNKEENTPRIVDECRQVCPVYVSDISSLEDSLAFISDLGVLLGVGDRATTLNEKLQSNFSSLNQSTTKRILYLIWNKPLMAAGKGTFIDSMIQKAGYENAATEDRYPTYSEEDIRKMNLDEIWLSSEPYSFKEEDCVEFQKTFGVNVRLVDGEMFSWYGSRLLKSAEYFESLRS